MGLLLLRMKELGISADEMELFTIGEVVDMYIEKGNDTQEWEYAPTQADFDKFMR